MEKTTAHEGNVPSRSHFARKLEMRRQREAKAKERSNLLDESKKTETETASKPMLWQRRLQKKIKQLEILKEQQAASQTEGDKTIGEKDQLCVVECYAPEKQVAESVSEKAELKLELPKEQQAGHNIAGDGGKEELCITRCVVASEFGVLVHGRLSRAPINTIEKVKFFPSVETALKKCVSTVFRLQAIAWPHIMDGNSFVCVSSPNTGKTFAVLPGLCSRLIFNFQNWLIPPGSGPVGIIICYSSAEVMRVGKICMKMLNPKEDDRWRVVMAFDLNRVQTFVELMLNGCALLVTTAPAYKAIYDAAPSVFMRDRIRVVAIDNFERMHVASSSELEALRTHWENSNLQMIVTSTTWHPQLATFLGRNKNTILCIGSYLEAGLYAKVKFQVERQRDCAEMVHALVQYLQKHDYRTQRTIVLTRNAVNLKSTVKALKQHAIDFLVCSDSSCIDQNDGFRDWDDRTPGNIPLLICLDELLADLKVSKAQHIVHYSMPSTWTMFTKRFAVSFDFFEKPTDRPSTLVLLNEVDNALLLKLVDLLQWYSLDCPEELIMLAQTLRNENAINGSGSALCPQLLALGACRIYRFCHNRHVLVERDLQHALPISGVVLLRVIKMVSPVHFRCWITDSDSKGDLTRLTGATDITQRTPAFGESVDLSIDVRVAGVVPSNNDEHWNKYSIKHAQQLVKEFSDKEHCYIYGNVLLTLHNMIWVDELFFVQGKKGEKSSVVSTEYTASIISNNYGTRSMKSFEVIKRFVQQSNAGVKQVYEPNNSSEHPSDSPPKTEIVNPVLSDPLVPMLPQVPDSVSSACSFEVQAPLLDQQNSSALNLSAKIQRESELPKSNVSTQSDELLVQHRFYRNPMTQWKQDDHCVTLYVDAPDVSNFDLTISAKKVQLLFFRNGVPYMLRLNLFGVIDAPNAIFECRGLSIIIRLPKLTSSKFHWPALISQRIKMCWLKALPVYGDTESESASEPEQDCRILPTVQYDSPLDDYESDLEEYLFQRANVVKNKK